MMIAGPAFLESPSGHLLAVANGSFGAALPTLDSPMPVEN